MNELMNRVLSTEHVRDSIYGVIFDLTSAEWLDYELYQKAMKLSSQLTRIADLINSRVYSVSENLKK